PKWTGYQLLALIFGTLLSSQGTDASFVLTAVIAYWGFPPGFRSCVSDSIRVFRAPLSGVFAFALSLSGGSDSIRTFPPDFPASDS
ncbi:hypothetical protein, partial [Streptomyces globosus]|uniref:hypothetical protein n=1 Tax=Streptomyces globosus TaxID=68209 RepID=UPI003804D9B3